MAESESSHLHYIFCFHREGNRVCDEVTRLAPHPKYKRRVRKKKKFQAHDPENQFQIGDLVQLEKCKPISKKKTFLAVPVPKKTPKPKENAPQDIGIPSESDSSSQV